MNKFKAWIMAARLRTLPLSIAGILVGSSLGTPDFITTKIFWFAIITTLALQILSNLANDYGDGVKGTDNENRVGPKRAIQSGIISKKEMFLGIVITAIIALIAAVVLIYMAFGRENFYYSIFFFVLGLLAIAAAIKYTMGDSAYGYRGLGDVFVFLFFGIVSVLGCYFLFQKKIDVLILLPAISIGALSTAVLNLNNLRDYKNDIQSKKNTLVVKLGIEKSKIYHQVLIWGAILAVMMYTFLTYHSPFQWLILLIIIPLSLHSIKVARTKNTELLDPELKKVALTTFSLAILFSLGQIL